MLFSMILTSPSVGILAVVCLSPFRITTAGECCMGHTRNMCLEKRHHNCSQNDSSSTLYLFRGLNCTFITGEGNWNRTSISPLATSHKNTSQSVDEPSSLRPLRLQLRERERGRERLSSLY